MEQNKGKGNDTLEHGLEVYCKTTIETGRINTNHYTLKCVM